ncbi:MAG: 6-pyruvoyl trahydropterin synthase family protein [Desulfobacteraceae bacterium]
MYVLAVQRQFVAQHYLVGGDWGAENQRHSHHYLVEVELAGPSLDEHGYLVDIVDIETQLDALVAYYRDQSLNELPEFAGLNPSIEHFARIFCQQLKHRLPVAGLASIQVKFWETGIAWAAYREEL